MDLRTALQAWTGAGATMNARRSLDEWSRAGDADDASTPTEIAMPANGATPDSVAAADSASGGQPRSVDCRNVLAGLADSGLACPPVAELLDVYIAWLIQRGDLAPPPAIELQGPLVPQP